jgi:monothiol glutaredoxin
MSSSLLFRRVIQQFSSVRLISNRFNSSSVENKNPSESSIDPEFKKKIDDFIKSNKIAIFIKGEPTAPRMIQFSCFCIIKKKIFFFSNLGCGFSNAVLQILNLHGCDFKSKNILDDEQLRQTMKAYR